MPVKHWSFAGLVLTGWCNASCASCYLCCSPERAEQMSSESALSLWGQLIDASPHGCRVHLTGGEPLGDWPKLIDLCRRAQAEGLGPLQKIETNAFWATDAAVVRERLRALDAAGMQKLTISTDPYHQQHVPIERCRLASRVGEEVLGRQRVQVRLRDWLEEGTDTGSLDEGERLELFARWAASGRDRLSGRAAALLAPLLPCRPAGAYADSPCREALLRSRHVHVDPDGRILPGTGAGRVLGTSATSPRPRGAGTTYGAPVAGAGGQVWRRWAADHGRRAVVGVLAADGPAGLLAEAREGGFVPRAGYAGKCQLCWELRRWFVAGGQHADELAPAWMYEP